MLGIDGLDVGWQLHSLHPSVVGDRTRHCGMSERLLGDFLLCVPAPWGSGFEIFSLHVGKLERGRRNGNPKSPQETPEQCLGLLTFQAEIVLLCIELIILPLGSSDSPGEDDPEALMLSVQPELQKSVRNQDYNLWATRYLIPTQSVENSIF